MERKYSRVFAPSLLALCVVALGAVAAEPVRIVPEGGLASDWQMQAGSSLAAPGYPQALVDRGDDVCVALGYRVQPDGSTSDFVMLGGWNSSRRGGREPVANYWNSFARAGVAAVSQWQFAPRADASRADAAVDTVAVLSFRGDGSGRTAEEVRSHCATPDLVARMQYVRRQESGRFSQTEMTVSSRWRGPNPIDVREAMSAASAYAVSQR